MSFKNPGGQLCQGIFLANGNSFPKSHGVLNTVPVGTCHFLLHTPLFLGMIQRGWVWGTDLGPNPICPLLCIENLGVLSNFIGSVFLSEKP